MGRAHGEGNAPLARIAADCQYPGAAAIGCPAPNRSNAGPAIRQSRPVKSFARSSRAPHADCTWRAIVQGHPQAHPHNCTCWNCVSLFPWSCASLGRKSHRGSHGRLRKMAQIIAYVPQAVSTKTSLRRIHRISGTDPPSPHSQMREASNSRYRSIEGIEKNKMN